MSVGQDFSLNPSDAQSIVGSAFRRNIAESTGCREFRLKPEPTGAN